MAKASAIGSLGTSGEAAFAYPPPLWLAINIRTVTAIVTTVQYLCLFWLLPLNYISSNFPLVAVWKLYVPFFSLYIGSMW